MTPSTATTMLVVEPAGYVPVHPKDRGLAVSPTSAAAHTSAMRTVLLYLIASTFDLREEETLWAGYRLDSALSPLLGKTPHTVPFAVRQEMLDGSYTRLLELRAKITTCPQPATAVSCAQPSLSEWVETFCDIIESSYEMTSKDVTAVRGQLTNMLSELGVGSTSTSRAATHLPTVMRTRMFTDRSRQSV